MWFADDPVCEDEWDAAMAEREALEVEVACVVACDPLAGYRAAASLGMRPGLFAVRPDMKLVYLACDVAGEYGPAAAASLAWRAIEADGDAGGWSRESVAAFFGHFADRPTPVQSAVLRVAVPRLLRVDAAQRQVMSNVRNAARLLSEARHARPAGGPGRTWRAA